MPEPTVILGELAEDFTAKVRTGQTPDIESYATQHPELAERIRELFPALMLLEGLAASPTGATIDDRLSDPTASLPPDTIFGQYRIVREIARGGMGIVYEAEHLTLHRQVALKVLPIAGPQAAKQLERFLREAKTAAGLHHTNIVPVFDVGQVRGTPYYAMQYINGESLDRLIHSEPRALASGSAPDRSLTDAARKDNTAGRTSHYHHVAAIGIQAAAGLAHAHDRGVIHRDIKPSNLLLDDRGVVWITDFGLARRHDDVALTHSGQIIGTPRYMSPEQAGLALKALDHRTDIYSLGATLYELLTRRPAFDGPTPQDVVNQIIAREPIRPRQLDPHVPRDLETIVLKAMAKRPEDRYPTAQSLADDLQRFTNGEPIQARRIGIVGRTWRWAKREPVVAGLVGAVVVSLLAGIIASGWYASLANRRQEETLLLLNDASYSLGQRQDEVSEPFLATLWFVEPLKRSDLSEADELDIRRRFAIRSRLQDSMHSLLFDDVDILTYPLQIDITTECNAIPDRGSHYAFDKPSEDVNSVVLAFYKGSFTESRLSALFIDLSAGHTSAPSKRTREEITKEWDLGWWVSHGDLVVDRHEYSAWWINNKTGTRPYTQGLASNFASTDVHTKTEEFRTIIKSHRSVQVSPFAIAEYCERQSQSTGETLFSIHYYLVSADSRPKAHIVLQAELFAGRQIVRGQFVPLSSAAAKSGWDALQAAYPDVFTVPIDDVLAWHLKDDDASIKQKHRHAALFAANFDCRDRPSDPHPFVARGRLFTALGEWDKAAADFAKAWQLGGTGWVKSEARRLGRDALNEAKSNEVNRQSLEGALRKAEIANKYLLPIGPHRWARVFARHRLGLPLDASDRATLSWLLCGLPMAG